MIPLDLGPIEARAKAATPGPWQAGVNPLWSPEIEWAFSRQLVVRPRGEFPHGRWVSDCGMAGSSEEESNAAFISAARSDVPDLIAEVRRLRALLREARERIDTFYGPPGTNNLDKPLLVRIDAALPREEA